MEMHARIQQTSDAVYAAWNAHNVAAIVATYAAGAQIIDITSGIVMTGHDAIQALAADRLTGLPDLSLERKMLVIDGAASADRWIMRATHTGEYQELAPTGNTLEVSGATFSEYNQDGLAVRDTHYVDVPGLIRQLGLH